jgi:hypothetical protein
LRLYERASSEGRRLALLQREQNGLHSAASFNSAGQIANYASRLKAAPDDIVQMFEPQEINIAVTGGEAQGAWKMFGARYERTVSIDAWR